MDDKKGKTNLKDSISDLSKLALNKLEKDNIKEPEVFNGKIEITSNYVDNSEEKKQNEKIEKIIDNKAEKVDTNSFNFAAAFLTVCYFMYNKLYVTSIVLALVIILARYLIVDSLIFVSLYFAISVVCGVMYNKYYTIVTKNRVNKLVLKDMDDTIIGQIMDDKNKKSTVLSIILGIMYVSLLILITFRSSIFSKVPSFIDSFRFSDSYKYSKYSSKNIIEVIETYNDVLNTQKKENDTYTYVVDDKKYDFILLPYNDEKENVSCSFDKKKWSNSKNYKFAQDSTSCEEYMNDVLNNYGKDLDLKNMTKAQIILSKDGKVQNNTYIEYNDITCKYSKKTQEFTCNKK